jgi:hypothetical protein
MVRGPASTRRTSPSGGLTLVHYYGTYSNAHRGVAARREVFEVKPTAAESSAG